MFGRMRSRVCLPTECCPVTILPSPRFGHPQLWEMLSQDRTLHKEPIAVAMVTVSVSPGCFMTAAKCTPFMGFMQVCGTQLNQGWGSSSRYGSPASDENKVIYISGVS